MASNPALHTPASGQTRTAQRLRTDTVRVWWSPVPLRLHGAKTLRANYGFEDENVTARDG